MIQNYASLFETQCAFDNTEDHVQDYLRFYANEITPFYESMGEDFSFNGVDGVTLSGRLFCHPQPKGHVVFLTGFGESYIKYGEFIKNLWDMGLSVYSYDHRGQGFSNRFENQKNRGYFDKFTNMSADLKTFCDEIKARYVKGSSSFHVCTHSMGGAVAVLAAKDYGLQADSWVLCSPMMQIYFGPFAFLETPLLHLAKAFDQCGGGLAYAFGQKDASIHEAFEGNRLTHSIARFSNWHKQMWEDERLQVGGATFHWAKEGMEACRQVRAAAPSFTAKLLLLQAGEDTIVLNHGQNVFLNNCPHAQKCILFKSRHEILMEVDFIRKKALDAIHSFLFHLS